MIAKTLYIHHPHKPLPVGGTVLIVLHALWDHRLSEKLHIWAEASNLLLASATKRGGRQAEVQPSHQHPYALSHALLREAINELAGSMQLQS
ncbi:MAG: hypothetical protein ABI465_16010, partial [Ktedonobacteraceae bacterium]